MPPKHLHEIFLNVKVVSKNIGVKMKFSDFKLNPEWGQLVADQYGRYYQEIWKDKEYDRFGLKIKKGDIVVDCGASIGVFSQYAASQGATKIIAIEADSDTYEYLKINTTKNKKIYPIYGCVMTDLGSQSYNLERILNDFNLEHIDFMKVDIEGREYEFILNTPDECIKKVKNWSIELHVWSLFANKADEYKKCFEIMEKFSLCGFKINVQMIHKNTCLYMLYCTS